MKRLIAIFFFVIYTATAFGVVVKFHFCNRALTHVSLSGSSDKCDRNSNSLMPIDCCKDKTICLKINSRIKAQEPFVVASVFHQTDLITYSDHNQFIPGACNYIPIIHFIGPQQFPSERIYLLNRVFRI